MKRFAFLQPSLHVLGHGDRRAGFKPGGVGDLLRGVDPRLQPLHIAPRLRLLAWPELSRFADPFALFVLVPDVEGGAFGVDAGHGLPSAG